MGHCIWPKLTLFHMQDWRRNRPQPWHLVFSWNQQKRWGRRHVCLLFFHKGLTYTAEVNTFITYTVTCCKRKLSVMHFISHSLNYHMGISLSLHKYIKMSGIALAFFFFTQNVRSSSHLSTCFSVAKVIIYWWYLRTTKTCHFQYFFLTF